MTADAPAPEPRDASEIGAAAARAAWAEAARPVLLEAASRYRSLVRYKELATAVQQATGITTTRPIPQWLGDVLGRVGDECHSRGEPLLSALCVTVQGSVGEGYAVAVERAHGTAPEDPDEHAAEERLRCYRHWEAAGLPRDGGTPLRTAHFTTPRKAPAAKPAARAPRTTRATGSTGTTRTTGRKAPAAAVAAPEPKPVPLCPKCFIQVPASGICDFCD